MASNTGDFEPSSLISLAHSDIHRIQGEADKAARDWVIAQARTASSIGTLNRASADYRSVDRIFQTFDGLLTDIATLRRERLDDEGAALVGVHQELEAINIHVVPIGESLRQVRDILEAYWNVGPPLENSPFRANIAKDFDAVGILIDAIVASEARREVSRIKADIDQVVQSASIAATGQLSKDFKSLADREQFQADLFRGLATAALLVTLGITLFVALTESHFTWREQVWKIAIDLPLILIAYYFSAESRDHRLNSRHAREIEVRLNTIRAYTDDMNAVDRESIRVAMGQAIFRDPVQLGKGDDIGTAGDALAKQLAQILQTKENDRDR